MDSIGIGSRRGTPDFMRGYRARFRALLILALWFRLDCAFVVSHCWKIAGRSWNERLPRAAWRTVLSTMRFSGAMEACLDPLSHEPGFLSLWLGCARMTKMTRQHAKIGPDRSEQICIQFLFISNRRRLRRGRYRETGVTCPGWISHAEVIFGVANRAQNWSRPSRAREPGDFPRGKW